MPETAARLAGRLLDTRRDSIDLRDRIYQPTLKALPPRWLPVPEHIRLRDQGAEGACTGFALAAMIDYLNLAQGRDEAVSARMLYEMAKRHDRWPGEAYDGSSARGAMKGWHKNGVCPESVWPYRVDRPGIATPEVREAALGHPMGAYYRVLPSRPDLHAALSETGALFVTAAVHDGWNQVRDGLIPFAPQALSNGGHAFCVVGYTDVGFIVQNSWGERWGGLELKIDGRTRRLPGLAIWTYADCEQHFWDAWVARPGLAVSSPLALEHGSVIHTPGGAERVQRAPRQADIADYYIHIDDGEFDPKGDYPSSLEQTRDLIGRAVDAMAGDDGQDPGHLLLYAHGGLNDVKNAAIRVERWRDVYLANRVHPIHFIWDTGAWAELGDVLFGKDRSASARAGGFGDWKDSLLERLTQPIGHALWSEMRGGAKDAFRRVDRAGSQSLAILADRLQALPKERRPKLHVIGHSAGAVWAARLLRRWRKLDGPTIASVQLFGAACSMDLYDSHLHPALKDGRVQRLCHYYLDDRRERDDSVGPYGKSILYLVSRAYQSKDGVVPLMGLEIDWDRADQTGVDAWNTRDHPDKTQSPDHGAFDNDPTTMNHALEVMLGTKPTRWFKEDDLSGY
jgi:hypothetical protein